MAKSAQRRPFVGRRTRSNEPSDLRAETAVPALTWVVGPLVFASGVCALIYQLAWQREFRVIFGASTAASAAVVAVFMGGLGLGAFILGPRVDRKGNPLKFYATLEALVAVSAAVTPALLAVTHRAYLALGGTVALGPGGGTLVRLALATLVLLPPTFLAGGTLGTAARAIEPESDRRRTVTGLLYGLNTLGAVGGCLFATFWLLEAAGTHATLWLAACLNLVVAIVAAGIAGRDLPVQSPDPESPSQARTAVEPRGFVPAAAGIVGFAFFLLELVWYRMLAPILGGTTYTFGLVLGVALAGVGFGGGLYAVVLKRIPARLNVFAVTCALEALAVAVPYALGDRIALIALGLRPPPGALLERYLLGWLAVTSLVVLPAAIVSGAQFPLLVALLGAGRGGVARDIGRTYFWNTVGAIVGALAGGFGLLPLLSAPGCWRIVAIILGLLAVSATFFDRGPSKGMIGFVWVGLAVVATTVLLADGPTAVWRHASIGVGRSNAPPLDKANALQAWINEMRRSVTWEREGVESSVAIQTLAGLSFVINGKVDGNARNDAPTQVMGGLLGAFLRPGARRSMVIGLGTGSTVGWLAALPGMEQADVVEMEPAILEVANRCGPVNREAMSDPRVKVMTGDAREVLAVGKGRYDLIFSEPSNPYRAGVASLFTHEFYETVASRLEPDGLFLQWLQAYEVDEKTIATIIATLSDLLPEVEIWQVHQVDLVLVAGRRPLRHNASALRARAREEPFATALRVAWRATTLEDVLARFVAGPTLARDLRSATQELNTDDRNTVEFSFARTLSSSGLFDVRRLREAAVAIHADRPAVEGSIDWGRVERQRAAIYTIAGKPVPTEAAMGEADRACMDAHARYLEGELRLAVATFLRQPRQPEGAVETTIFAEGLADSGDLAALAHIQALREISTTEAEAATARLALRLGKFELARDALVTALVHYRTDPWPSQVSMAHALALAQELAIARRDMIPMLLEALNQPFAVAALEEPRQLVRLYLSMASGVDDRCGETLTALEPNVPWRSDVLRFRVSCYERLHSPRAVQARVDLQEYERHEKVDSGATRP